MFSELRIFDAAGAASAAVSKGLLGRDIGARNPVGSPFVVRACQPQLSHTPVSGIAMEQCIAILQVVDGAYTVPGAVGSQRSATPAPAPCQSPNPPSINGLLPRGVARHSPHRLGGPGLQEVFPELAPRTRRGGDPRGGVVGEWLLSATAHEGAHVPAYLPANAGQAKASPPARDVTAER